MIKHISILAIALLVLVGCSPKSEFNLSSPDGKISLSINVKEVTTFAMSRNGVQFLNPSSIAMDLGDTKLGVNAKVVSIENLVNQCDETVAPLHRQAVVKECYNQLLLNMEGGYSIEFRVYDSGAAYRFITSIDSPEVIVYSETSELSFANDYTSWVGYSISKTDCFATCFQFPYDEVKIGQWSSQALVMTPFYVDCGDAGKLLVSETDLRSYPGLFFTVGDSTTVNAALACLPDSFYIHPGRCQRKISSRTEYLAKTDGCRTYPWRILAMADCETQLATNDLVYILAEPSRIEDTSWIKGGKVAWDWWNNWDNNPDHKAPPINTATYKRYIDFASEYGLEYVVLDEGWYAPKSGDMLTIIPEINLPELVAYGKSKNVDLILWAVANTLDEQLEEANKLYSQMGIKGFKIDFIDRDDQEAVDLVYRVSEGCAKYKMLLDIHGMYKPTGLNRTFPNIVNFEGVYGLEEVKWANPDVPLYDVTFPYIRQVQGPADYTAGAFRNATKEAFQINYTSPMSQGTRAHQVATYVVFDSPLVMLCDAPTLYEAEPECTRYIASIPTVWDETKVVYGKIGKNIVTARRSGDDWYVGGLTSWTPCEIELSLDKFLPKGSTYTATILEDTEISATQPTIYAIKNADISSNQTMKFNLAPGGGFAMILKRNK